MAGDKRDGGGGSTLGRGDKGMLSQTWAEGVRAGEVSCASVPGTIGLAEKFVQVFCTIGWKTRMIFLVSPIILDNFSCTRLLQGPQNSEHLPHPMSHGNASDSGANSLHTPAFFPPLWVFLLCLLGWLSSALPVTKCSGSVKLSSKPSLLLYFV